MAKGNLFLGMGRGSVGDVTFTRIDGEQVSRARNRKPRNPQTAYQLASRVFAKTVQQAYSLLQPICDHSFQGLGTGTPNQSRFMQRNVAWLRERNADALSAASPIPLLMSQQYNYANKETGSALINQFIVSEGSIPTMPVSFITGAGEEYQTVLVGLMSLPNSDPTYQELCDSLGVQAGDQLTFMFLAVDDTKDSAEIVQLDYARVILMPSSGDMTAKFLNGANINLPNPKNTGTVNLSIRSSGSDNGLIAYPPANVMESAEGNARTLYGAAVIVSRLFNNTWQRSEQRIVVRAGGAHEHDVNKLGAAILSYKSEASSSLYLNQADSF